MEANHHLCHGEKLHLDGAQIRGDLHERNPPISLPQQPPDSPLLALDIGGTLIKVVYFLDGLLRFEKFERRRLHECLEFIQAKKLLCGRGPDARQSNGYMPLKATGGGSYKYADIFKDKLGVSLDKLDEIDSVVAGANFLLKKVPGESFTHMNGNRKTVDIDRNKLFPYLLVNIGSGVSIIKVTGNRKFERVTGTQIGGGTMFGLAKLLTGCLSYDEFLKLSQEGDNLVLDLIVKDICGELVSEKQGLSASTLASSFGKVITSTKTLSDYKAQDLATTLLSAFTYNIAQISFLVAAMLGLKRVFFGGSYIRGHPSTMDNISYAINYWSKGQVEATFLRHEGFLGALGALTSYENLDVEDLVQDDLQEQAITNMEVASNEVGIIATPIPPEMVRCFAQKEDVTYIILALGPKEAEILQDNTLISDGRLTTEHNDHGIFPYLLVNIGSGVSMIEVIGKRKFERIIGTHLGGGTILGLARLLTGCTSYEEFLELSQRGNNLAVDLTVGDIYGELGYPKLNLPASTTASSFGKVTSNKISDYRKEDLAAALLNAFTYNIGQISYFVAKLSGLKKIFFRGTYVCGHEKTMDKISRSLKYWSKDQLQPTFLSHEGFMGTVGAFFSYENMGIDDLATKEVMKQVLLDAPYIGGKSPSLPPKQLHENGDQNNFKVELDRLRKVNAELNSEVERLRCENAELKAKLEKL